MVADRIVGQIACRKNMGQVGGLGGVGVPTFGEMDFDKAAMTAV